MKTATPFYTRLAHIFICIISAGYLAILGKTLLAPLLLALLFAMLLLPAANFLEKRAKFSRAFASMTVLILLIGVVSGVVILLGTQLTSFANDIPAFESQLMKSITSIQDWISQTFHVNNKEQIDYVTSTASSAVGQGTVFVGLTLLSLSTSLLFMLFTFLYTFFLLLHRKLLVRFVVSLFREEHSPIVLEVFSHVQFIIRKYIAGLFLQMVIVTVLAFTALSIIGVKYAFLLAMLMGLLNVIPYLGIFTALIVSVLVTFATAGADNVLLVAVTIVCIHLLDGNFIMPKIVGSKVKLNTLAALLGLIIGEMVWGITGMLLALPIIAILKVIFDRVEGLKPWGMVLGDDENAQLNKK